MPNLSPSQVEFFRREGYLVAKGVVPGRVIEDLRVEIAGVIDAAANRLLAEGKITDLCSSLGFLHRLTALKEQCSEIMHPVLGGGHAGPALFGLMTCPEFLDA